MARQMTSSQFHKSKTLDNKYVNASFFSSSDSEAKEETFVFFFDIFDWQMLGDEIGKGAYGRVYIGLDLENGDFVAIKQVSLENIVQEDLNTIMVWFLYLVLSFMD